MKKRIFFLLWVALSLFSASLSAQQNTVCLTRFEGERITGIAVSSGFEVSLVRSNQPKAVVEISEDLEESLQFILDDNGVVRVSLQGGLRLREMLPRLRGRIARLTVWLPELNTLTASGAVMVSASGDFESRQARIRLSGASRLTSLTIFAQTLTIGGSGACQMALTGYVDNLSTELSGASRASLSLDCQEARFLGSGASEFRLLGESEKAEIVVTSASSVRAYGFTVGQLKATASGASGIRIRVSEQIDASATGASTIRYEGDPEVRSLRSSSSGSIRKGND